MTHWQFRYWQHHQVVAGVLPDFVKTIGRTVFGFLSEILEFAWLNCPKPRLELPVASQMHISRVTRSGSYPFTHHPPFALEVFLSPIPICYSKYIFFIYLFLFRSQPYAQVDNKLSKSNGVFSVPHTVTSDSELCTVIIIIIIIRTRLPYGKLCQL